jgi:hypothetical protein
LSSFLKEGNHEVVEDFKNPSVLRTSPFKKGDKIEIILNIKMLMTEQSKKAVYVLDWYTNKNIKVVDIDSAVIEKLKPGDKLVYSMEDNHQKPSI